MKITVDLDQTKIIFNSYAPETITMISWFAGEQKTFEIDTPGFIKTLRNLSSMGLIKKTDTKRK